jgi:hypothetical protein
MNRHVSWKGFLVALFIVAALITGVIAYLNSQDPSPFQKEFILYL